MSNAAALKKSAKPAIAGYKLFTFTPHANSPDVASGILSRAACASMSTTPTTTTTTTTLSLSGHWAHGMGPMTVNVKRL